jgi:dimethylaniline monooxygenase (N-oxide forming)
MVCTGHHADKKMAQFEGEKEFKGQIIHSHDYRDHRGYEEKRVVVVGIGNSGGDVAVELGKISKQVYLSTRRGAWILNRVWDDGLPLDMIFSRFAGYLSYFLPISVQSYNIEKALNARFDHKLYGLKPAHRFFHQHPTVNDDLPNRIISGAVIVKPDIKRLTQSGVEFVDGSKVENIDTIISATGYIFGFPFIEHSGLEVKDNKVNLYKLVFPPDLEPLGSLAVIGCFQPLGGLIPCAELQARWAIRVFKGECELPSSAEMWKDIEFKRQELAKRYVDSTRHTIQVDIATYQMELSELCGCKPNLLHMALTDPKLAYHVLFGPYCPYQNRLVGPGAWPGAREAVLTTMDRIRRPFKGSSRTRNGTGEMSWIKILIVTLLLAFLLRFIL